MGETTGISWCDHTFNPWIGCTKVSAGCEHCYAERENKLYRWVNEWGPAGERKRTNEANWRKPLAWDAAAKRDGVRRRVFCGSLCDVYEDRPELTDMRADLYRLIAATQHLDWLLLTKRPENIATMMPADCGAGFSHIWLGTTAENQEMADRRIPELLEVPAAVHFVSCEPLLSSIDLTHVQVDGSVAIDALGGWIYATNETTVKRKFTRLDWVIVGGESGPDARPMHPAWTRYLHYQCQTRGVPFFFKQWGEHAPYDQLPEDGRYLRERPYRPVKLENNQTVYRVGKKAAGDLLDDQQWHEFPR